MICLGIDIGGTSVKIAAVRDGVVLWTGRSAPYALPDARRVGAALCEAMAGTSAVRDARAIGLCAPGLMEADRRTVKQSVNLPGLNGVCLDTLVEGALRDVVGRVQFARVFTTVSDANATALDLYLSRGLSGRLFVLAIGAGVGAAVLDEGARPLSVDGDSPGHFGQMDVSVEGEPVIGPDRGAGSLEGYLGAAALAARYGGAEGAWVEAIRATDPPMRALVRALRIAHALYRPHHVCLAGGIGNRLARLAGDLHRLVSDRLTNIARPGWTLTTGDSDFHAAQGAARAALAPG